MFEGLASNCGLNFTLGALYFHCITLVHWYITSTTLASHPESQPLFRPPCPATVVPTVVGSYIRTSRQATVLAATCSDWQALNLSAVSPASYAFPIFPPSIPKPWNLNLTGSIGIYTYLGSNCTNSPNTGFVPLLNFKLISYKPGSNNKILSSKPYTNKTVFGYGFTGTCAAPGNLYRDDPSGQVMMNKGKNGVSSNILDYRFM